MKRSFYYFLVSGTGPQVFSLCEIPKLTSMAAIGIVTVLGALLFVGIHFLLCFDISVMTVLDLCRVPPTHVQSVSFAKGK